MKRRDRPESAPVLPRFLAVFDPADWSGAPMGAPMGAPGSDRQWKRLRWNRAVRTYRRKHR